MTADNPGNTLEGRLEADAEWPFGRIAQPADPGGCCAVLKLGRLWARWNKPVMCSRRALPEKAFCGQHDHLNVIVGLTSADEYLRHALIRSRRRGEDGLQVLRRPE